MFDKIKSMWDRLALGVAVVGLIATVAVAGNEMKKKASEYEQAITDLARIAKKVDQKDFLVDWLFAHGEDSATVSQWTMYPRAAVKDSSGKPLLNILFLDPELLPEKGVLKMFITPDSSKVMLRLWDYPTKKN